MAFLAVSFCALSQEDVREPQLADESLTTEQIAVYRAVLREYLKGSDGVPNLADTTKPLDQSGKSSLKGIVMGGTEDSVAVIHRIEPSLVANTKIVLVNFGGQLSTIKGHDPQNLINRAIDDHGNVTDEQLDESVKQAFQNGLFTLSEIAFDKEHHRAVVAYGFACGMLCGHGNTLVLKKIGQDWRVTRRCGSWVS